jgi:hypothetical protein
MSTEGFDGAPYDDVPLDPSESLDSDEIRNDDGDDVADPPERWIEAKEDETLDERLADEEPDVDADADDSDEEDGTDAHDSDSGGGLELLDDAELDRLDTQRHGIERGQIDGTPEDGESFFDVVE